MCYTRVPLLLCVPVCGFTDHIKSLRTIIKSLEKNYKNLSAEV